MVACAATSDSGSHSSSGSGSGKRHSVVQPHASWPYNHSNLHIRSSSRQEASSSARAGPTHRRAANCGLRLPSARRESLVQTSRSTISSPMSRGSPAAAAGSTTAPVACRRRRPASQPPLHVPVQLLRPTLQHETGTEAGANGACSAAVWCRRRAVHYTGAAWQGPLRQWPRPQQCSSHPCMPSANPDGSAKPCPLQNAGLQHDMASLAVALLALPVSCLQLLGRGVAAKQYAEPTSMLLHNHSMVSATSPRPAAWRHPGACRHWLRLGPELPSTTGQQCGLGGHGYHTRDAAACSCRQQLRWPPGAV